tara:strand:+ start:16 stop:585 length:570 start_codon:yes stop_codon:yes gene_type:complete
MRIIGGKLKGSILYIPKNKNTRPLKDLTKESIFNLLNHSNEITFRLDGSNILDLYSGIGSFGLECLSRDANYVYFVENQKFALEILKKNIRKLKIENKTKIFFNDVFDLIKKKNFFKLKFNLIFCDPPFKNKNTEKLIELIYKNNLLDKNGIIILHRNKFIKEKFPSCFNMLDERVYGMSKIIFGNLSA